MLVTFLDFVTEATEPADVRAEITAWAAEHLPTGRAVLVKAQGPSGWPLIRLDAPQLPAMTAALTAYAGGPGTYDPSDYDIRVSPGPIRNGRVR